MKKILIISPHFPPSGLAGVHRTRLFAMHLPAFGWKPVILCVHEKFYEEQHDWELVKLLPEVIRIEKVKAFPITKPRVIGDIGLRGFIQLTRKTISLIRREQFDFLYIPIPSFYISLIGRIAHAKTGIPYGIDYIDPWVHIFPGSDKMFSRHWWSTKVARFLEPIAVKKAVLITGVSEGYFQGVADRNIFLKKQAIFAAMPYGGEQSDHDKLRYLALTPYLFRKQKNQIQLVYAGAMLPKAYKPLEKIFEAIGNDGNTFNNIRIHFIGTGKTADDEYGYNIKPLAEKYNLWYKQIFEYPKRIPYLDVLTHLNLADGIFILGSTEPHYTPSKVYQAVLSKKPVWAILHKQSTACEVIRESGAGVVLDFDGEQGIDKIFRELTNSFKRYLDYMRHFDSLNVNQQHFERYSAKAVTETLVNSLNRAILP